VGDTLVGKDLIGLGRLGSSEQFCFMKQKLPGVHLARSPGPTQAGGKLWGDLGSIFPFSS
jgi:hypothetical protein